MADGLITPICEEAKFMDEYRSKGPLTLARRIENFFSFLYVEPEGSPCHFNKDFLDEVKAAALRGASTPLPETPAGMVLVPRELTAENGMKFHLSGDFSIRPDPESDVEYIVPWDTIKQIHRRVVELAGTTPASATQATTLATENGLTPAGQHISECERDAARYRWWRERWSAKDEGLFDELNTVLHKVCEPGTIDAAIDAAMRAVPDSGGPKP